MNTTYKEALDIYTRMNKDVFSKISALNAQIAKECKSIEQAEKDMAVALDKADTEAYKRAEDRRTEANRSIGILNKAISAERNKMENRELAGAELAKIREERNALARSIETDIIQALKPVVRLAYEKLEEFNLLTTAELAYIRNIKRDMTEVVIYYPPSILTTISRMEKSIQAENWMAESRAIQSDINDHMSCEEAKWRITDKA